MATGFLGKLHVNAEKIIGASAPLGTFVIKDSERSPAFVDFCTKYFYGIVDIMDVEHGTLVETLEPHGDIPEGATGIVLYNGRSNFTFLRVGNSEHLVHANIKVRKVNDMKIKVKRPDGLRLRTVNVLKVVELLEPIYSRKDGCILPQGAIGYKVYVDGEKRFVVIANALLGLYKTFDNNPPVELVKLPITLEEDQ